MNSIRKITIENFQSHKNTTITPGAKGQLTVITGPSDAGKTVILRALRWLFFNEPQGADFIRVGASFARVTAELGDAGTGNSNVVVRHRTAGGTNRYLRNGDKFEGFGYVVPLEVQEITGVRPVAIGDLSVNLNLADQLAGPFLGSSISAGARAKVLGKLAGTEEIDYAGKQLGTDLYRRNQEARRLDVEVNELTDKLKSFDWLPDAARKIEALEGLVTKIKSGRERLMNLEHKRDKYNIAQENIYECLVKIERWQGLEQAAGLSEKAKKAQALQTRLTQLKEQTVQAEERIAATQGVFYRWRDLDKAGKLFNNTAENQCTKEAFIKLACHYLSCQKNIRDSEKAVKRLESLNVAEELHQKADTKKRLLESLKYLSKEWILKGSTILGTQKMLNALVGLEGAGAKIMLVSGKIERRKNLNALWVRYEHKKQIIVGAREQAVLWENRVAELCGAYHDVFKDAGVCPLCGALINEMRIKEAV